VKILIIDDSPDALAVAKARLTPERLDILCADSGQTGLAMVKQEKPDLVLLDVDMPDLSGFDVCRALKADPDVWMIPVVFLSGSDDGETKVRGLDLGAVDYVTKPFDAFELRARVRAALRTKRLQDLLAKYAKMDSLTELLNRRGLRERLQQAWARMQRHGGALSFIMADIDHFKRINDSYGHPAGDGALRHIAQILAAEVREDDCVARYGGEEYAILCGDIDSAQAGALAERCRLRVEQSPLHERGRQIPVTLSLGVADASAVTNSRQLIEAADTALYQAKQDGRNRVILATPADHAQSP